MKIKKTKIIDVPFANSSVDIVVPFYGQYKKVYELIQSIWRQTKTNKYQIYLIDDCSENSTFIQSFKDSPYTTIVRNEKQLGFGGALYEGFKLGKNPWVVFLNSDCKIEYADWLLGLGQSLLNLKSQNIKMVAAKSNNPGNYNSVLKQNKFKKTDDFILEGECLPLYCVMCHRQLFDNIKGFVKSYPYGSYEDEELYYRMKKFGYKQAVSGNSWVFHHGGSTFNDLKNEQLKVVEQNRQKCIEDIRKLY